MLAVHRQEGLLLFSSKLCDQLAASNERLLVGQQHALAAAKRLHHRSKTHDAHDGHKHIVRIARAHDVEQDVLAEHPLAAVFNILRNFLGLNRQRGDFGMHEPYLLKKLFTRGMRDERADLKAIAVPERNVDRLRADRTGRTENGNSAHISSLTSKGACNST